MQIRPSLLLVFLVYSLITGCSTAKSSRFGYGNESPADTISTLDDNARTNLVAFKAPNGKIYYAKRVPAVPSPPAGLFGGVTDSGTVSAARSVAADAAADPATEQFRGGLGGGVREEAKTTFSTAAYQNRTLRWLVNNLPSNAAMEAYNLGQTSPRCAPENKNVRVRTAYLYVFKHEDDKDYHILMGNKADYQDADFIFNAEISGLPVNFLQDNAQLTQVRREVVDFFKTQKSCTSINYVLSIPIEIKGSLFYDYHHKNTTAKCKDIQANTAWEIHPVHSIIFK
ncbi:MAG: hypothetical protein H7Y01_04705 [Ferruginibacter sp.]|nr:hypothetical protein [Chitinophagaceae bacterium]